MTRLVYLLASLVALLGTAASAAADGVRAAVVVEGDPSTGARAAALRVEAALRASGEIELPTDDATRLALVGEPGTGDDGLDPVRALRRRLGWSDDDREAFASLAGPLGLTAIVLVRGGEPALARVYDVGEARFFEGAAAIEADSDGSAFLLARLRAAERRRVARATTSPSDAAEGAHDATAPPDAGDEAASSRLEASASTSDEPAERPTWIRRNWPFLVAGSLLVGATTFFVVRRDSPDESPPVIHIRPAALRW